MAFTANGWLIAFVVSMRYTMLKGWPGRTQAVFISALIGVIASLTLAVGWRAGH